jgi:hypothetical protein
MKTSIPTFILKDGWLGADGTYTVSLSDSQAVFLFSDTYVGRKKQTSRKKGGLKMVSNSAVIVTCLKDGKSKINYYWKQMSTDNPQPLFQSFTKLYRFWCSDVFRTGETVHVVLAKIGPKRGAAPDDLFNFNPIGFTLASISNPFDTPDKWKTELIPLPEFSEPEMALGPHAITGAYLYFFVNGVNVQRLVRKKAADINDRAKPFEYFARDNTWKTGIRQEDMDTVIHGFRGSTVNFHPDLRKWVMVCDIHFPDNKIRIRTASRLEGPWTEDIEVFACPEVKPGSSVYHKSNSCYNAREIFGNYDAKNKSLLISYDVNNSSLDEIISNPNIYVPRLISVPVQKFIPGQF